MQRSPGQVHPRGQHALSCRPDAWGGLRATFQRVKMPTGELRARLAAPPPPFKRLAIRDLLPPSQRDAYDAIVRAEAEGVKSDDLVRQLIDWVKHP